jgi:predicted O-methyltransferase YrrM
MMNSIWDEVRRNIFGEHDPYAGFNPQRFSADLQGWNSHHLFLSDSIERIHPRIVLEIGVWKGGSTIFMAEKLRQQEVAALVIAVDTFLGSWEHYEQAEHFPSLMHQNGYPSLFYTFLTNVMRAGVQRQVIPLPLDSANAAHVIGRKGIRPDIIHIDAGHDFEAVSNDLKLWWPLLAPGGIMIADDYDSSGVVWPSVRDAVDRFLGVTIHSDFEAIPYKARWGKPF